MKCIVFFLLLTVMIKVTVAQPKEFEGIVEHKSSLKSKVDGVSDKVMKTLLASADQVTIYIKEGNYLISSAACDQYFLTKQQRVYTKFKALDTLYYIDYSTDTSSLLSVTKLDEEKTIVGKVCKAIEIKNVAFTAKYFYAPSLYMNPEYDRNNKIGRYDIYTKETHSIWLGYHKEGINYSEDVECVKMEAKLLDETLFTLPTLPQKIFSLETVMKGPEFKRTGGWAKYLSLNINPEIGAKYIKIPKGEKEASQKVVVKFLVNENGKVMNAFVENKDEVHPKLAEEALRVVSGSPLWSPATIYGERIAQWFKQDLLFQAIK